MKQNYQAILIILLLAFLSAACSPSITPPTSTVSPGPTAIPTLPATVLSNQAHPESLKVEVVEEILGLVVAMAFGDNGRLFYATKQGGVFVKLDNAPAKQLLQISAAEGSENGLLGLALSPNFANNHHFFIYYNVPNADGAPIMSRVVRYTEQNGSVVEETIIIDNLPASPDQFYHFGGGLSFGPDGKLYFIFGDRNMLDAAVDPEQLPGSVLRYNEDGTIPDNNPFSNSPVYAYGIRNGFGLTWHPETGQLYETENGVDCDDELNLILPGENYGWGVHQYDACPYPDSAGQPPVYQWTPVVAPVGLLFYTGDVMPEFQGELLVCGFNQSQIFRVVLDENGRFAQTVTPIKISGQDDLCRVAIIQGPNGWIYTSTINSIQRIGR